MGPGGRQDAASERPLISIMLQLRQQLGLSDEQVGKLTGLRSAFEKEAIRAEAELRVADLELGELLDQTNVDLAKAEAAIRKEESIRTTLRVSRIKTIEAGKALLTGEQREKLKKALEASPGMGPGQPMGGSPIGSQMMGPGGQGGGMMMGPQMMQQMMGGGMGQQAAAGPSPSPAPPGSSERVDTTGPVTVKATLLAPGTAGDSIRIQIVLDTHSVGLDGYRFEEIVRLRDGRGGEVAPAAVEGAKGSGHHREATIRFAWPQPKPKNLELVVKGVAGVPERLFRWSLQ
jgi:Spy/CpxP family protein refolding chaperone